MPKIDRINGQFVAVRCTFEEKSMFKRHKWKVDPKLRKWATTDVEKVRPLREYCVFAAKEYLENTEKVRESAVALSWAADTDEDFPAPEGLSYMPFQRAGIAYAIKRQHTLIADPPGLGKTIQAVGIHNAVKTNKVLVICPASLKVNWSREWRRWDVHGLTVGIAMSMPKRKTEKVPTEPCPVTGEMQYEKVVKTWTEYDFPDTDVVIINYDMLYTFDDAIKAVKWDLVIADEAHLLKTEGTVRNMCVFGGKRKARKKRDPETGKMKVVERSKRIQPLEAGRYVFLTGTPILSKPVELWPLVQACDPKGLGASYTKFIFEFCAAYYEPVSDTQNRLVTDGASNLDELNRLLRERFMVRRNKKEVLKDLPDKIREMILLPQDKLEKPLKREKSAVEAALESFEAMMGIEDDNPFRFIDDLCDSIARALDAQDLEEPDWEAAIRSLSPPEQLLFTEIAEAREEVALAKVSLVAEHVLKLHEAEEPVILFAYHKTVVEALKEKLEAAGLRVGIITGSVPSNKRQAVVDKFQNGELDVVIGNILAMGVGFTMTRGRFVVFAELDWVPALIEQAEDRAWRNGQKNMVIIQYLMVDGSIEAQMAIAILEKMGIIFQALDAEVDHAA